MLRLFEVKSVEVAALALDSCGGDARPSPLERLPRFELDLGLCSLGEGTCCSDAGDAGVFPPDVVGV